MGVTDSRSLWGSGAGGWRVAFRVLHEVFLAFVIVLSYNRFVNPCEIKYDILGRKGLLAKEFLLLYSDCVFVCVKKGFGLEDLQCVGCGALGFG